MWCLQVTNEYQNIFIVIFGRAQNKNGDIIKKAKILYRYILD